MLSGLTKGFGTWTGDVLLENATEPLVLGLPSLEENHRHGVTISPRSTVSSISNYGRDSLSSGSIETPRLKELPGPPKERSGLKNRPGSKERHGLKGYPGLERRPEAKGRPGSKPRLHKTYTTRNGALVLYSDSSEFNQRRRQRSSVFERACLNDEALASLGNLSDILTNILEINDETAVDEDDDEFNSFKKTLDKNNTTNKPGGNMEEYMKNLKILLNRKSMHCYSSQNSDVNNFPNDSEETPETSYLQSSYLQSFPPGEQESSVSPRNHQNRNTSKSSEFYKLPDSLQRLSANDLKRYGNSRNITPNFDGDNSVYTPMYGYSEASMMRDNNFGLLPSNDQSDRFSSFSLANNSAHPLMPAYKLEFSPSNSSWMMNNSTFSLNAPPSSPTPNSSGVLRQPSPGGGQHSHRPGSARLPLISSENNGETADNLSDMNDNTSERNFLKLKQQSRNLSKKMNQNEVGLSGSRNTSSKRRWGDERRGSVTISDRRASSMEIEQELDDLEETVSNLVNYKFNYDVELTKEELAIEEDALKENLAEVLRILKLEGETISSGNISKRRLNSAVTDEIKEKWRQQVEIRKSAARDAMQREKERRLAEKQRVIDELAKIERDKIALEEERITLEKKQQEEALRLERIAEEARLEQEAARAALLSARKSAHEQRADYRRAVIEQKKKDALLQRAEARRLLELSKERERAMLESIASSEEKRRFEESEKKRKKKKVPTATLR